MARNATKCVIDGYKFDSLTESRRYLYLKDMQEKGQITNLTRQIKHELLPAFTCGLRKVRAWNYISDFEYDIPKYNIHCIEDVKGRPEPVDKYKRKMLEYINKDAIDEGYLAFEWICEAPKYHVCSGGECWVSYDELNKIRKQHKKEMGK